MLKPQAGDMASDRLGRPPCGHANLNFVSARGSRSRHPARADSWQRQRHRCIREPTLTPRMQHADEEMGPTGGTGPETRGTNT